MATLKQLLDQRPLSTDLLAAHLDRLDPGARLEQTRAISGKQMGPLFDAADREITLEDVVPTAVPALTEVVHNGKNSLPAFSEFAKVFCRPDDPSIEDKELWGYNRGSKLVETAVGPGYFIVRVEKPGEVLVDYYRIPPRKIPGWPPIMPNHARLSRFVFHRLQDVLRGVSKHVSIGRERRDGKYGKNYFVLCRQD